MRGKASRYLRAKPLDLLLGDFPVWVGSCFSPELVTQVPVKGDRRSGYWGRGTSM